MTRHFVIVAVLVVALMPGAAGLFAQAGTPRLSIEALEARAMEQHPAIREAAARVEAARGRAAQAGAWDNPTVGGGVTELRPRESPSGTFGLFAEQTFALGGKRQADRAVGSADVTVREAELEATRLRVRLGIRAAYYEVSAAVEALAVGERLSAVAEESVTIARQLMNVGIADRQDLLEAEADAARQRAALGAARARQNGAWRRLAAMSGDMTLVAQPVMAPGGLIPALDREASLQRILAASPELKTAEAEAARDRLSVDTERRRVSPDLSVRAGASWNREQLFSLGPSRPLGWEFGADAGVTLPLFNKNRGGVRAATASATASEIKVARVRLDIEARFATVFADYETARTMAEAYRTEVLPRLEEAHGLYLARYREMATPYPQVLMAQRKLVDSTEQYVELLSRAWNAAVRVQGLLLEDWR